MKIVFFWWWWWWCSLLVSLPPGKRLHNDGKLPFFMGTSTISMAIFNSELLTRQWPSIHVEITTEMDAMDGFLTIKHGLGKRHCCFYMFLPHYSYKPRTKPSGWWLVYLPQPEKWWSESQLGWWHSQYGQIIQMFQTTNQEFSVWPQPSHAEHLLLVMFWGTGNGYVTFPNSSQDHVNHVFLHRKVPTIHQAPKRLWRLQDFRDLANLRSTVNRNTSTNGKIKPRESHIICVRHILSVSIIEIYWNHVASCLSMQRNLLYGKTIYSTYL